MIPFENLTTTEVADLLGISPATVKRRCEAGEYAGAEKVRGRWYIPRSSLPIEPDAIVESAPVVEWRDPNLERLDTYAATVSISEAADFLRVSDRIVSQMLRERKLAEVGSGRVRRVSTPSIRWLLLGGRPR